MTQITTITYSQSRFTLFCRDVVDASGHKHGADGKFGSGGSAKKKSKPEDKPKNSEDSATKPSNSTQEARVGIAKPVGDPEKFEKKHYSAWQSKLSASEKKAIEAYTGYAYEFINKALRNNTPLSPDETAIANDLDKALKKTSAPENFLAYRTVSPNVLAKLEVGKTLTDNGFMSTTLENGAFEPHDGGGRNNALIHLEIPKGTKGAAISELSKAKYEYEFLLPRGSKIKIHKIERVGKTTHVHATVVN